MWFKCVFTVGSNLTLCSVFLSLCHKREYSPRWALALELKDFCSSDNKHNLYKWSVSAFPGKKLVMCVTFWQLIPKTSSHVIWVNDAVNDHHMYISHVICERVNCPFFSCEDNYEEQTMVQWSHKYHWQRCFQDFHSEEELPFRIANTISWRIGLLNVV